jgi:hypothetical protein
LGCSKAKKKVKATSQIFQKAETPFGFDLPKKKKGHFGFEMSYRLFKS